MKLFDYIFYRVNEFYLSISKDISDLIVAPMIVTIIQMMNLFAALLALSFFFKDIVLLFDKANASKNKLIFFIVLTLILAYNIYRYSKIQSFDKLKKKWSNDSINIRKRKTRIILAYILLSIFFLVYLTIIYK